MHKLLLMIAEAGKWHTNIADCEPLCKDKYASLSNWQSEVYSGNKNICIMEFLFGTALLPHLKAVIYRKLSSQFSFFRPCEVLQWWIKTTWWFFEGREFLKYLSVLNKELFFMQAMLLSTEVEVSEDHLKMRTMMNPEKWPIINNAISSFSRLNVDVPEFVPRKSTELPSQTGWQTFYMSLI